MNELNDLMQNEYEAMTGMDTDLPKAYEKVMDIIRTKVSQKEFLEIEDNMLECCNHAEKFGFEQGFMRGVIVMKGGAIA